MTEIQNLYEKDFNLWIAQTIQQLENHQFESLDLDHLIEELEDLGKSEKRALESNLMILLAHLLKLKVQFDAPDSMKNSWYNSIDEHRKHIQKQLKQTPSLKAYLDWAISESYHDSRDLAIKEGKRGKFGVNIPSEREYPLICPFSLEQILDDNFYAEISTKI
jgi:hypothetical protein